MSATSYYDVVVVGYRPSALLAAAALLSKRGFRVLLLGQGELEAEYGIADRQLPQSPFTFLAAHTATARRVLGELALQPIFRRKAATMDPVLQVVQPGHRTNLPFEQVDLEREIDREFMPVKRAVTDFFTRVEALSDDFDHLTERDLVWPPTRFFERREHARATAHLPFDKNGSGPDLLGQFPEDHPFRLVVRAPTRFVDSMDPNDQSTLSLTRAFAAWTRGSARLDGGFAAFIQMLRSRVEAHGGEVRRDERAARIVVKRNQAVGVVLERSEEQVGCGFVIAGTSLSRSLRLLSDRRPFEELFERIGEPQVRYLRMTVNVVVAAEGVPEGMARDVFMIRDPRRPLHADNLLRIEAHEPDADGNRLLCVQLLVPRRGVEEVAGYLEKIRDHTVSALRELMPFVDRHVRLIDSPHDGRDAQDLVEGRLVAAAAPWARGPATMEGVYGYPVGSTLGVCALPVRTPVRRLLLCNDQVVPGLGQEGEFLAAWSAAPIVTRSDRKKEWMRRGLWTKVEM